MIKKPGAFSNRYMSNPLPLQHHLLKERNKENRNPNCVTEERNNPISNCSLSETKIERPSPHMRQRQKTESKIKTQYEKQAKELKELNLQVTKLRKQNQRLRQDVRRTNKSNQQNICSYEAYIKELEGERDKAEDQAKAYSQNLKFCIIWMIEAYALSQDPSQHQHLLKNKLGKQKMGQVFKKLITPIENLQLKKRLLEIAKSQSIRGEQYLICSKDQRIQPYNQHKIDEERSIDQFNDMLDTFDLQRNKDLPSPEQDTDNVARKLFVNEDTFGQEIGQHDISHEFQSNEKEASRPTQILVGTVVTVKAQAKNQSQDYLRVIRGDEIKLLKKVGDLWIAQKGCRIGYITEDVFR